MRVCSKMIVFSKSTMLSKYFLKSLPQRGRYHECCLNSPDLALYYFFFFPPTPQKKKSHLQHTYFEDVTRVQTTTTEVFKGLLFGEFCGMIGTGYGDGGSFWCLIESIIKRYNMMFNVKLPMYMH